jgi:hypothetical protein
MTFRWPAFGISAALIVCVVATLWTLIPPAYDTNDDATIRGVLEGTRVPGQPATGFALLPHAALGWLIVAVREVWPSAYAWDVVVTGTLVWGLAVFASLVWGSSGSALSLRIAAIAAALAAFLPLLSSVQYTISSTIAGGAAMALAWFEWHGHARRRAVLVMAAGLLLLALLVRSGAAMAGALAVSACLLPFAMRARRRGLTLLASLAGGAAALFLVLHAADVALYKLRPEWDAYRLANYYITAMFDWNWQAALPASVDITGARTAVGWTASDWAMLEHAFGVSPELFNLDRVRAFYEATAGRVAAWDYVLVAMQRLWTVDRANLEERLNELWPIMACLAVVVLMYVRRQDLGIMIAVLLCFVAYCIGVQAAFKSLPFRLLAPMAACFVAVVLTHLASRRPGRIVRLLGLVLVLALCGYQSSAVLTAMQANHRHSLQVDAEGAALAALEPSLVVIHTDTFPEEHWQRPFHRPDVRLLMIRLGRNNQNPQLQSFLRASGLSEFPSSMCDQPSVVIISEQGRLEVVSEEMRQRFDRSVIWNPFYMASFRVWQCLPAPAD